MESSLVDAALGAVFLLAGATWLGISPVRRLIRIYEAKHELKHGSAGWLRSLSGWSLIALWLLATWFVATIIGDWGATGDLPGAMDRSWLRLRIILEILIAILESDN
ncbi:hypothetical protein [Roseobacter sinensis]|uniref:Uncharacterized protein n=1 Tax=Roseobacter sinensis TaxID=2931391 RepID=A0ABT3BBJ4_9RHOB|nr:hypothetical protein [Roseobacter sp. WL0113]MCV3270952.1 hypothetical protein [Roseobacter sp. WL0113]